MERIDNADRFISLLVKKVQNLPYHRFMGMEIVDIGDGCCSIRLPIAENILNPCGAVHGGVLYSICDVAAYLAVTSLLPVEKLAVTAEFNVSILSAVRTGIMNIYAAVLKYGKRLCVIESRVIQESDMVAIARITKSISDYPEN